ncbi:hypothetical protein [Flavobacterium sp.]|uniref:hypothetical protein n=1 Tax=Flavobacterium sp. TaxID=239 RepID=UPI00261C51B3|nr:hypothetical protein [Flavobacterium sp.]
MKKYLSALLIVCLFSACSVPKYAIDSRIQRIGVDFSSGTWLLNYIDAPADVVPQLEKLAIEDFSSLNKSLTHVSRAKGLLIPNKIELNPSKIQLENLKKGSGYDYFVNIQAKNNKVELSSVDLTPHRFNEGGRNVSEVTIEIYDLNALEIIYSKKVIGSVGRGNDNHDVHFAASSNMLILGGYKKLMRELKKKSHFKK